MFLLVSVPHAGAHPGGHQHCVSIQISINLGKTFRRMSRIRNILLAWILARVFVYLPPFISQIPDFIYWTVLIFGWRDTENQQSAKINSCKNFAPHGCSRKRLDNIRLGWWRVITCVAGVRKERGRELGSRLQNLLPIRFRTRWANIWADIAIFSLTSTCATGHARRPGIMSSTRGDTHVIQSFLCVRNFRVETQIYGSVLR